jgi:hypothetical protein
MRALLFVLVLFVSSCSNICDESQLLRVTSSGVEVVDVPPIRKYQLLADTAAFSKDILYKSVRACDPLDSAKTIAAFVSTAPAYVCNKGCIAYFTIEDALSVARHEGKTCRVYARKGRDWTVIYRIQR